MIKRVIKIPDMHCPNCAITLESLEDELPGVRLISASYRKQQMVVEFDESVISIEELTAAVRKKGYQAVLA